jgi:hypothetical protein
MKKTIAALAILMLCACSPQPIETPVVTPSALPPTATATAIPATAPRSLPTQTSTRVQRRTPIPLPTNTPFPSYQTKQVLFSYTVSGWHTNYDVLGNRPLTFIVIYFDGQMILARDTLQQKMLTAAESRDFIAQLGALGFFKIESNQKHDPTDRLYHFGSDFVKTYDGLFYCLTVNGDDARKLCAYDPYRDNLIPEMKNVLYFLDHYSPKGTSSYIPDRVVVRVRPGRDPDIPDLPKDAIAWPNSLPSLGAVWETFIYLDGEAVQEFLSLGMNSFPSVILQDGKEYTVDWDYILPHEVLTNPPYLNP